ncbi:MAG: DUF4251 domain-containing protein [Cytophagales bacterium]|nr:DUF4251 domain-containing protein [Cytophagales bacterium]
MRSTLIIILSFVFLCPVFAQETTPKKLTRKERKELRKQERQRIRAENLAKTRQIADSMNFILQAHTFVTRYGNTIPVNSTVNFFATDGENATIQLALSDFIMGANGVGGITIDGMVSKYKAIKQKHATTLLIDVFTALGTYHVTVYANYGGISTLRVVTMRGQRFELQGTLLPLEENFAFKGTPSY